AHERRREDRAVGERLVHVLEDARERLEEDALRDRLLDVSRAEVRGDLAGVARLVEGALLEADRVGPELVLAEEALRERGDGRAVDAAREEDAERDVRAEADPHRLLEEPREARLGLVERDL